MLLDKLRNYHEGKTCAILGGGISLVSDLHHLPDVDRLVGVNQHALILDLDYVVFSDKEMWKYVEPYHWIYKISHHYDFRDRDDYIDSGICPQFGFSGARAIWVCDFMGFDQIHVCGIDHYDSHPDGREYWWQIGKNEKPQHHKHNRYINNWKRVKDSLNNPERVSFVSGRVKEVWNES